jgi:hypothetical protein
LEIPVGKNYQIEMTMKLRIVTTFFGATALLVGLTGCSTGDPQTLGGKCELILASIEKVRSNVSPEFSEEYSDLLMTVNVYDNYALNDVIGELSDLALNGEDQLGSASNYTVFQDWFSGITGMNQYAYASGQYVDFASSEMGPTYLNAAYESFATGSADLEAICSAE